MPFRATKAVTKAYQRPLRLVVDETRTIELEPSALGARPNVPKAIRRARLARPGAIVPLDVEVSQARVRTYVEKLGQGLDRKAIDARVVLVAGMRPRAEDSQEGRILRVLATGRAIRTSLALNTRAPIRLPFEIQKPEVTSVDFDEAIVIQRESKRLVFFDNAKYDRWFGVATGQSEFPTPLGSYEIVNMQRNPWWYPPPSDWAADSEPVPPGPWQPARHALDGDLGAVRRHPRHPRRLVHRLLGFARLRPDEDRGRRVAVPAGGGRHAGLHRLAVAAVASRARLVAQGVAIGLVVLLFVLLAWSLVHDEGGNLAEAAARGERPQAPDFTLERLDEAGDLQLSSLRGKAVVLNVWASWCVPCKDEAPYLEEIWRENRGRGLVVLGLDAKDFRGDAKDFVSRFDLTFPVVFDGPGDTLDGYGVTGFPETFVLDREGRVVKAFVGPVDGDDERPELRAAIEEALTT